MTQEDILDLIAQEIEKLEQTLPLELPRWVQ